MAESLALLGAFSSALQLVECVANIVSHTYSLISVGTDGIQENESLKRLALEYSALGESARALACGPHDSEEDESISEEQLASKHAEAADRLACDYAALPGIQARVKRIRAQTTPDEAVIDLAKQCEEESQRLMTLLGTRDIDRNAKGGKRLAKAFKAAMKTVAGRKDVQKCRTNLQELNGQLSTAILQVLYEQQKKRDEQVPQIQSKRFDGFADLPVDDNDKVAFLVRFHKEDLHKKRTNDVIESLQFSTGQNRWHAIDRAYPDTYEWALFQDSSQLRKWLKDEDGVFWVSGKAGSGKSTLMKFVCTHLQTQTLLARWNGTENVIIASFFFWYAGTALQKSTEGLLRTMLWQVLTYEPNLTEPAFPQLFDGYEYSAKAKFKANWDYDTLVKGFKRVAASQGSEINRKKFCFFIDGLDEYHGDHLELLALLQELTASKSIKLCVSSRPWNAFRRTFGPTTSQLRLEDLSKPDILKYTDGRISRALTRSSFAQRTDDTEQISSLIAEIVEKAEGVFLWVVLVVTSVIRGFTEGDPVFMLRYRVQQFPADLGEFFRDILGRVEAVYKQQTHQALKLAFMLAQDGGKMQELSTFIDYWLIGQTPRGLEKSDFPFGLAFRDLSDTEISEMMARTQNMLCSVCKDLLSVTRTGGNNFFAKVDFLHRTVYDFLQNDEMQLLLDDGIPDHFKSSRILHLLNLARLKFRPSGSVDVDRARYEDQEVLPSLPFSNSKPQSASDSSNAHSVPDGNWNGMKTIRVFSRPSSPSLYESHGEGSAADGALRSMPHSTSCAAHKESNTLPYSSYSYSATEVLRNDNVFERRPRSGLRQDMSNQKAAIKDSHADSNSQTLRPQLRDGRPDPWTRRIPHYNKKPFLLPTLPTEYPNKYNSNNTKAILSSQFEDTGSISVALVHQDLDERFLQTFADATIRQHGQHRLLKYLSCHPQSLSVFLAFPTLNVGCECLAIIQAWEISCNGRRSFFLAALGENRVNRFDVDQVNPQVIKELCRLTPAETWPSRNGYCAGIAWELFMRKWTIFVSTPDYIHSPPSKQLEIKRHLWDVAKVFLNNTRFFLEGSNLCSNTACEDSQSETHERGNVGSFLRSQLPEKWMQEFDGMELWLEEDAMLRPVPAGSQYQYYSKAAPRPRTVRKVPKKQRVSHATTRKR